MELVFVFPETIEDPVLLALHEAGTLGVTLGESDAARSGARVGKAYFENATDLGPLVDRLTSLGAPALRAASRIEDPGWVERQAAGRKPIAVGRRLLIVPERSDETIGANERIVIVVPPRRAFGTGEHATTRLCLEILESIDLRGRSVLDFGTGSGILAIAAARLGAGRVSGIDNDPEAIAIAGENLRANDIAPAGGVGLTVSDLGAVGGSFDVVVSNIEAGLLEREAARLGAIQREGSQLILSGFTTDQAGTLCGAFLNSGFEEIERRVSGEWCALHLVRREGPLR